MYTSLIIVHVLVSFFLIAVILLQAGRGGGLADTFGGSQMQNLFGTRSTAVLAKLTTICATIFIITSLSLAVISSQRTKSLVDRVRLPGTDEAVKKDIKNQETAPEQASAEVDSKKEAEQD